MYASSVTVFPTLSWSKPWSLIQKKQKTLKLILVVTLVIKMCFLVKNANVWTKILTDLCLCVLFFVFSKAKQGLLPSLEDLLFYTIAEGQEKIPVHKFITVSLLFLGAVWELPATRWLFFFNFWMQEYKWRNPCYKWVAATRNVTFPLPQRCVIEWEFLCC